MDNDQLDDLKQFIDSRISQSEIRIEEKIEVLRKEVHDGFVGAADDMDDNNKLVDDRLTKLEQQSSGI